MKVTWELPDGSEKTVDVAAGLNLMEAAVSADIPNVIGECGGNLSCATCHVYVDPAWQAATGVPEDFEDAMLDATDAERTDRSRLSCQITMSDALDGLRLRVPEA